MKSPSCLTARGIKSHVMKSFFQKHLLLFGIFLMLMTSVAKGQNVPPYYISGPSTVCAAEACVAIRVMSNIQGGMALISGPVQWSPSPLIVPDFQNGGYAEFCRDYSTLGVTVINFWATVHTNTGEVFQLGPFPVQIIDCNFDLTLSSDASQFCPADNIVLPPPPPPSGFTLTIGDATNAVIGQQACLEVTVNGFFDILGMQFSISYDPAVLQFTGVTNLNLNGLSSASFGNPEPGIITMTWNDPDVSGISRPDGGTIFCLCFNVLSGACTSEVTFSNTPIAIEILNGNLENVPFNGRPGHVQVTGSMANQNPLPVQCCEQVCAGAKVRYTASSGTEPLANLNWIVTGETSYEIFNNGQYIEVLWGSPGSGTVSVGAFISNFNRIQRCVNIIPIPESSFSTNPQADGDTLRICQGQSVDFTNTTQGEATYLWQFGNGRFSAELNPEFAWAVSGTYRMALIAYNECLCMDTTFLTVVVSPVLAPDLTCRGTICEGSAVTYTTDSDCGTFFWAISPNGVVTDGGGLADNFITIDWDNGPEGYVELRVENCATNSFCAAPNRMRVPIISESAEISGPVQVCRDQLAAYAIPSYGGIEYTWAVSSMGNIQNGQGTNEVEIQWTNTLSTEPQWVAVEYYNCYLECGGADTIWVSIQNDFYIEGPGEVCEGSSVPYSARLPGSSTMVASHWEVEAADGSIVWTSAGAAQSMAIPWTFGSGSFSIIIRPAAPNSYCIPLYSLPVQVVGMTAPPGGVDGETAICPGVEYTYSAAGQLPGHRIEWRLTGHVGGLSNTIRTGEVITVQWGPSPPYQLVVTQLSPQGCRSNPIAINLMHLPPLSIVGDTLLCAEETSVYTAPPFDRVNYTWTITPTDAGTILGTPNSSTIEILWHKAGPVTLALSVCNQNLSIPITINPTPKPQVIHPEALCPGETAILQTTELYSDYSWKNATGAQVSNAAMPDLPFGYYQVLATNSFGCTGESLFHMDSYGQPDILASTPDNTGICPGDPPSTLYALDTEEGYTYQWFHDENPIPGATNITYPTVVLGDYRVEVTDHNGCKALSNQLTLFFYCGPDGGGFPCNAPPGTGTPIECDPNTAIQFEIQATPVCNISNYLNTSPAYIPGTLDWDFGDPASGAANTSNLENPSHTFSSAGFFAVYLFGQGLTPDPERCFGSGVDTVPLAANFFYETACAGDSVHFFNTSTYLPIESVASWQWDFGDPTSGAANTSADKDPSHVYPSAGAYTVTLTAIATSGCSVTKTQQVVVAGAPDVSFELPAVKCADTALPFSAETAASSARLVWHFGDPVSGAADTSGLGQTFHRYKTPGTYSVRLEATNIYGCINTFSQDLVITPNTLSGSITFTSPICEGDSSLLTPPSGGVAWAWSTGETAQTIWVREEGVYSVVVSNAIGCQYSPGAVLVKVIPAPQTTIRALNYNAEGLATGYEYGSLSVCSGADVFLEVIELPGQTYLWSNGEAGTQIEFSQKQNNLLPEGEHEVFVTVTDVLMGCIHLEGPFLVIVRPLPNLPVISAMPAGMVCEGTLVTMSVNNPEAAVNYAWSSGVLGNVLETTLAGQYEVTATNEWGCANTSDPNTILAGPNINLIPSGCHTRCSPDVLCFPDVPGVSAYQWFFNGQPQGAVSATAPEITVTQSGDYYLHMTTNEGCSLNSDPLTLELLAGFGSFRGQVYWDLNNNGALDAGDSLLVNVPFILLDGNVPLDTVFSQTGGQYGFSNILSTAYGLMIDAAALPLGLAPDTVRIDTALVGCDVEMLINWRLTCPQTTASLTLGVCPGNTVEYNGVPLPVGATMDLTLTNTVGCDSLVTVTVVPVFPSTSSLTLQACPGSTVTYAGTTLAVGTVMDFTLTNAVGCDSIVTVTVEPLSPSTSSLVLSTCPGSTVVYNGATLSAGTTMDFTLTNAVGCDSIVTVTVNALPASMATLEINTCPGNAVDYNGTPLEQGTTTEFTFVNASGCDSVVIVTVTAFELPEFQVNGIASCPNQPSGSIEVSGQNLMGYALNGGAFQTTGLFEPLVPGAYSLAVEDGNGCIQTSTLQIGALPGLQVQVANTILPCNAESITLEVFALSGDDGNLRFLWDNGETAAQRIVDTAGEYRLTAINNCDTLVQTITVAYEGSPDDTPLYVPNAFSPNGDGINDAFQVYAATDVLVQSFELMVFDRWGNQLFHTKDPETGWNGLFRGRGQGQGVYTWWMQATVFHCGRVMAVKKKGGVTVVR